MNWLIVPLLPLTNRPPQSSQLQLLNLQRQLAFLWSWDQLVSELKLRFAPDDGTGVFDSFVNEVISSCPSVTQDSVSETEAQKSYPYLIIYHFRAWVRSMYGGGGVVVIARFLNVSDDWHVIMSWTVMRPKEPLFHTLYYLQGFKAQWERRSSAFVVFWQLYCINFDFNNASERKRTRFSWLYHGISSSLLDLACT